MTWATYIERLKRGGWGWSARQWVRNMSLAMSAGAAAGLCIGGHWADVWMFVPGVALFLLGDLVRALSEPKEQR